MLIRDLSLSNTRGFYWINTYCNGNKPATLIRVTPDYILKKIVSCFAFSTAWLQVMPFFNKLGFECPSGKGDADFLQDVTIQKGQDQFRKDKQRKHAYMSVQVCACCAHPSASFWQVTLGVPNIPCWHCWPWPSPMPSL